MLAYLKVMVYGKMIWGTSKLEIKRIYLGLHIFNQVFIKNSVVAADLYLRIPSKVRLSWETPGIAQIVTQTHQASMTPMVAYTESQLLCT
jgi:hypothetical protein